MAKILGSRPRTSGRETVTGQMATMRAMRPHPSRAKQGLTWSPGSSCREADGREAGRPHRENLSERTREAYLGEAAAFVRYFVRPPTELGEAHV